LKLGNSPDWDLSIDENLVMRILDGELTTIGQIALRTKMSVDRSLKAVRALKEKGLLVYTSDGFSLLVRKKGLEEI
jgi:hypothetical protein